MTFDELSSSSTFNSLSLRRPFGDLSITPGNQRQRLLKGYGLQIIPCTWKILQGSKILQSNVVKNAKRLSFIYLSIGAESTTAYLFLLGFETWRSTFFNVDTDRDA